VAHAGASVTEGRRLLAFSDPSALAIAPSGFPPKKFNKPNADRQGLRLGPQFAALSDSLAAKRLLIMDSSSESDPEMVIVFDLAGSVEQFSRAVARIPGFEFLFEQEDEKALPDEDFYFLDKGEPSTKLVPETLYGVMSNASAVSQMIDMFELWHRDRKVKFPHGLNSLKQVFELIRKVRRWGPEDRVRETGVLGEWAEEIEVRGVQSSTRVEIELWFRPEESRRAAAHLEVQKLIEGGGGSVISSAILPEILYHGILAELPYTLVQSVLVGGPSAIELLLTDRIMLVGAARPMAFPVIDVSDAQSCGSMDSEIPDSAPKVALLDGVPLANHVALAGRLIIDDPDGLTASYTNSMQQQHGTGMASLIVHGDLESRGRPLRTPLYVRPILQPDPVLGSSETFVRNELLVDVVFRTFYRMFEGDGGQPASAPSVRIVNLAIGYPARTFVRSLSPLAKLLDWLSHRYNLVILVSAGNHQINAIVSSEALNDAGLLRSSLLASHYEQSRLRRLLAPAEAINVITVGALHSDSMEGSLPDTVLDVVEFGMPALYSAVGLGFRRSIKPEVLLPGGRSLFQRPPADALGEVTLLQARTEARGPGIQVAAPGTNGALDATVYSFGTSNATALATRSAHQIMDVLELLEDEEGLFPFPDAQYHPVLTKALLVHAASWGSLRGSLRDSLVIDPGNERRAITQILGYGAVALDKVASASRTRALVLGAGSISAADRHRFSLPLPPSLAATTEPRRLTITLAWLSPVNTRSQKHRMARLVFHPSNDMLGVNRTEAHYQAVRRGTVQHEILQGNAAVAFVAGDFLNIDVDCRIDAGKISNPVRYGLAVSIETATTVVADIHAEIRTGLQVQLRQKIMDQSVRERSGLPVQRSV
jgi:hypothetical protein